MPSLSVDFSVYCENCGHGLCSVTKVNRDDVYVEPCPVCMEEKQNEIDQLERQIEELEEKIAVYEEQS